MRRGAFAIVASIASAALGQSFGDDEGPQSLIWNPDGDFTWSTNPAKTNWLDKGGSPTAFANGDTANFTQSGLSIVIIDPAGVVPAVTNFSNESGMYTTVNGPISGSGAVVKTGAGSVRFDNDNEYNGGTVVNGGVLLLGWDRNLGDPAAGVTMGGGTIRFFFSNFNSSRTVTLTDDTSSSIVGHTGNATFGTVSGGGSLIKNGAARLNVTHVRAAGLDVAGGELRTPAGPTPVTPQRVSDVETLKIAGGPAAPTARLDLTNNAMIVGSFPLPGAGDDGLDSEMRARQYIRAGYANGAWTGNGIASSTAAANNQFALGYARAGQLGITTFAGLEVQSDDVIIRFTRFGDADLNGVVDFDDYAHIDNGFNNQLTGWHNGDFDYNDTIDFDDYALIDLGFNSQSGTLRRAQTFSDGSDRRSRGMDTPGLQMVLHHFDQFGDDYAGQFLAAVPEPGVATALVWSVAVVQRRRRASPRRTSASSLPQKNA